MLSFFYLTHQQTHVRARSHALTHTRLSLAFPTSQQFPHKQTFFTSGFIVPHFPTLSLTSISTFRSSLFHRSSSEAGSLNCSFYRRRYNYTDQFHQLNKKIGCVESCDGLIEWFELSIVFSIGTPLVKVLINI